jgi:hypothetical protein
LEKCKIPVELSGYIETNIQERRPFILFQLQWHKSVGSGHEIYSKIFTRRFEKIAECLLEKKAKMASDEAARSEMLRL